jgi:PAS domain S-box-containing protein
MKPDPDEHQQSQEREQQRQSQELYRLLVEGVKDYAIFLLDPQGHVATWNAGAERIKGYAAAEIIGRHFSCFYPPEDVARGKTEYELRVAAAQGRFEDEDWRVRKDGSRFWANVVLTALRDEAGRLVGFAKVTRDLTERRRAEEQRRQLDREQAARTEAEAATRRRDQFLSMLAHELRNPLAPVLTGLTILRRAGEDHRVRDQTLDMMDRQVRHLRRLVDDLLDVARITRGKVELHRERLDLARLVRTATADSRPALEQAGLTLAVQVPETPVWVRGDGARLVQVVANLLDNAVKFTARGGHVSIDLAADAAAGQAVLTVRDTGIGIARDLLTVLFEPFAQAARGPARSQGGLGLGLSVVKGLVEMHGGRVEAASAGEGRGTEFRVRLPVEAEPAALSASSAEVRPTGGRLRVIIIEDNKDAADSLRLLLEALGYETRVAYTGPDGLHEAVTWGPDAVLSDVGLPGLNGLSLAAELRRHPATARSLLVGISGYGSEEDVRRARQAGFDHYLVKPADPAAIQQLLAVRAGEAGG